jgi:hypothetical protein
MKEKIKSMLSAQCSITRLANSLIQYLVKPTVVVKKVDQSGVRVADANDE